ncbi:hypothetical protein HNP55_004707 [Paucibacter oligotrophus]|uniref:Uncharacterized protein n=1 Tax=Roseateles oligotrophus TaxID=1769250 RepID=A0A840LHR6_9BURK|nr:hypothetical protein [Roseateles oligotrophus]MBB4846153.1 hypothetical protein [Roseateles oligotrophus]
MTLVDSPLQVRLDCRAAPLLISRLPEPLSGETGLLALQQWQAQMLAWLATGRRFVLVQFTASEAAQDAAIASHQARWYKAHKEALFGLCDGLIVVGSSGPQASELNAATQKFLQALPVRSALVGDEGEARRQAQAWMIKS